MKVLIFGATGMIGQGVLQASLADPDVTKVVTVGRTPLVVRHKKLHDMVVPNVADLSAIQSDLTGFDACFFCLGVSAIGLTEARYTELTYDLTLSVAHTLVVRNPSMTFAYVTGMSTDSSENGRVMWARVKGRTENALLALPFKAAYMFRPGFVQPGPGIKSKTGWYQAIYSVTGPLIPVLKRFFPKFITTTDEIGRAMLNVARTGYGKKILETGDISAASGKAM